MAIQAKPHITQADFEAFIKLPENSERRFELLDGEIVEAPSNPFVSMIAGIILYALHRWRDSAGQTGYITGEGGGYIINGQVFAPDVAYGQEFPTDQGFGQTPPLLAVEVISDPRSSVEQRDLRRKLAHYMQAGVVVWVVDYVTRAVDVHVPGEAVILVDETGTLDGGAALPGFELPVKDIFPKAAPTGANVEGS